MKLESMKNKVIIGLHGLKSPGQNDFEYFYEYAKDKLIYPFVTFEYFENNNKETLNRKHINETIAKEIKKQKDEGKEVILLGYSLGATAAVLHASKDEDLKNLLLLIPTYKIGFWSWIGTIRKTRQIKKNLIKKLGKERYKQMMERMKTNKNSMFNRYVVKLIYLSNIYRKFSKPYVKKLQNKNIQVFHASSDAIVQTKRNDRFLRRNLDLNKNNVKIEVLNTTHTCLKPTDIDNFDKLINVLNTY